MPKWNPPKGSNLFSADSPTSEGNTSNSSFLAFALPRWASLAVIFVFWALIALLMVSKNLWDHLTGNNQCANLSIIYAQLPQYGFWALVTPFFFKIPTSRWFTRAGRWPKVAFFLFLGTMILILQGFINGFTHNITIHSGNTWHTDIAWHWSNVLGHTHPTVMIYLAVLSSAFAWNYFHQSKARQLKEIQLQNQLTQARLQALQIQIQPHFLFNTLNTVSALVDRDPAATKRVVSRLSQLLRYSLDSTQEQTVTLSKELAFLKGYIEILEIRFDSRMVFELHMDQASLNCMVPNLLLQPLVENAIKHGFHRIPKQGRITIGCAQENNQLHLWVYDNGCGTDLAHLKLGLGLGNLKDRLHNLYGEQCYLEIGLRQDGGLAVDIFLPIVYTLASKSIPIHDEKVQSA